MSFAMAPLIRSTWGFYFVCTRLPYIYIIVSEDLHHQFIFVQRHTICKKNDEYASQ